jgi:predicted phosphodiesterase
MRLLLVGDVHSKVEDLEDCGRLLDLVEQTEEEYRPDYTVYLGDQYDTHALVHVEVQRFWRERWGRRKAQKRIAIVGNHDRPGSASALATAMQVHTDQAHVVSGLPFVVENVAVLPYFHDRQKFLEAANALRNQNLLICHQTFTGAKYDNGFFAKDGIEPGDVQHRNIISGHIHTPAAFGKVWYPGSPRWQTVSDANIDRHLWVIDVAPDGSYGGPKPIATDTHLRKLWSVGVTPDDTAEAELACVKPGDRVVVNIQGPTSFIEEAKKRFAGQHNVRIRTFPTDKRAAKLSEVEGVPAAFRKHLAAYQAKFGTDRERLRSLAEERLHVG